MNPDQLQQLETLVEAEAVRSLLVRCARANDEDDWEAVLACFAQDGRMNSGQVLSRGDFLEQLRRTRARTVKVVPLDEIDTAMHVLSNFEAEFDSDGLRGRSLCVARSYLLGTKDGMSSLVVRGFTYTDDLVREDGHWRILNRVHSLKWMYQTVPVAPGRPL